MILTKTPHLRPTASEGRRGAGEGVTPEFLAYDFVRSEG
jgi:hypothetical protein